MNASRHAIFFHMTVNEVRSKYLAFFKAHGHVVIPSAPIVPENDPTTLFTSSGMQPLVPYLLGKDHPEGKRLTDSQLSFRAGDIEEVGDNRHTTFFEMLGNWSLGDYFKKEQLSWCYEFLTEELKLPTDRLWVTCFAGDETLGLPKDTESAEIWKKIGVPEKQIHFYDAKKNWWSRSGTPDKMPPGEPGGPDSEVFFDFGTPHDKAFGEVCHPNCDCGRFMEIGNSVFMEYLKQSDGSFAKLPKQNVDFGGGLERLTAATRNDADIFLIDVFDEARHILETHSHKLYTDKDATRSFRIILDHVRAAIFILAAQIRPSNTEQGYILRRLIRRAIREMDHVGIHEAVITEVAQAFISVYGTTYTHLTNREEFIVDELTQEEERFSKTLQTGLHELEKMGSNIDAFMLFTTYGFPIELTLEIAEERGILVDLGAVQKKMQEHQALSRAGAAQKFAGGLADHSEQTIRYHTAHHLLLKALQIVLGPDVHQRGSNITSERLRIDFSYEQKMTSEQIREVERIVNEKIKEGLPVIRTDMPKEEAEKLGAEHEFGATYPDRVSVYSVGPLDSAFSIEFCGGPHVTNTGELKGTFKIIKEEASSASVRRIKAVLE